MNCWSVAAIFFLHSQFVLLQFSSSCNPMSRSNLLPLPLIVIVGGNSVVAIRTMLVVQREIGGLTPICNCGENITTFQPQTNPKTKL